MIALSFQEAAFIQCNRIFINLAIFVDVCTHKKANEQETVSKRFQNTQPPLNYLLFEASLRKMCCICQKKFTKKVSLKNCKPRSTKITDKSILIDKLKLIVIDVIDQSIEIDTHTLVIFHVINFIRLANLYGIN